MADQGVYVHVPFCATRCDYCAFATWSDRLELIGDYFAALVRQAADAATDMAPVTSVFVGGGTPNMVPARLLTEVLDQLPLEDGAEVTVECNPDVVTDEQMWSYAAHGVERISLGVQSMVPSVLASLGRTHDPSNVYRAVEAIRAAGIERLNLDIIYGAAGESLADWHQTLDETVALAPDHVSAYALTVEAGTALADDPARHPDDDDQADKYRLADEVLTGAGLENYEISNWARPGQECRHNLLYWTQGNYVGLGCAAHSHVDGRRSWSIRTPEGFVEAIESGESVEAGSETLGEEERRVEALQLAVRLAGGVEAAVIPDEVRHLVQTGDDGRARLTLEGRLLANEVAVRLN
ncbi:MAG: radical SAM family heme chaperone HemW [Actinomycetia bacterium]|nr:radical SAM family heme chaperone HemW [Actinomycetes bacterium]MCP4959282.1 radical SAM family heme chaperone HemW [Actinomycetes bacterium]